MTLKTRNFSLITFICLSSICFIASFAFLFTQIYNGSFESIFGCKFFSPEGFSLFKGTDKNVIIALLFLQIYIPVTALFLFFSFEKTQSTLIILFGLFLLGCQLQVTRLLLGLFDMKNSLSLDYLVMGKAAFLGHLLCIGSFFLLAASAKNSQKLDIEMDIFILLAICILITVAVPLRTTEPAKNLGITPGYTQTIILLSVVFAILTIITFLVSYKETEDYSIIKIMISYCHLVLGQAMLNNSNILIVVIIGAGLLTTGTNLFMSSLHKMYLWD